MAMMKIEVPRLMKNILKDINRAVLREQSSFTDPEKIMTHQEIVDFLAQYLNTVARLRDNTGQNPLELIDEIEAFDDEEEPDLYVIDSTTTDEKTNSYNSIQGNDLNVNKYLENKI